MIRTRTRFATLALAAVALAAGPTTAPAPPANDAALTGTVFVDTNGNGHLDAGEQPCVGAVVYLEWLAADGSGRFTPDNPTVVSPITATRGILFNVVGGRVPPGGHDIIGGQYQLHVVPPAGYVISGGYAALTSVRVTAGQPCIENIPVTRVVAAPATKPAQPAAPLAAVVVTPPVAPTTAPVGTFTVGLDGGDATGNPVTLSPAPATLHVHALNLQHAAGDWLGDRYAWSFGDPGRQLVTDPRTGQPADVSTAQTAPVAAYLYEQPGTYAVGLSRWPAAGLAGPPLTYVRLVVVPPAARTVYYVAPGGSDANAGTDPAHPLATLTAAGAKLHDHTAILLARGGVYPTTADVPLKHADLLVDCYGDATLPLPVVGRTDVPAVGISPTWQNNPSTAVFTTWPGQTSHVVVRHLHLRGPFTTTPVTGGTGRVGVTYLGLFKGLDTTVTDVEVETAAQGVVTDAGTDGVYVLRVVQTDAYGVPGRLVWAEGQDVVLDGIDAKGSSAEIGVRVANTGIVRGSLARVHGQQIASSGYKGAISVRTAADVAVYNCRVDGSDLGLSPRTSDALDQRLAVTGCQFNASSLTIDRNVRTAVVADNVWAGMTTPAINVNPGDGVSWSTCNLTITGNPGATVKTMGAVAGLVTDAAVTDSSAKVVRAAVAQPAAVVFPAH